MNAIKAILEALAVGDAMGMPTEFMTQEDIDAVFPAITGLLDPKLSYTHHDMPFASVTDDTEQNLYLAKAFSVAGEITIECSADALSRWIVECDAVAKKYIGPSSLKALNAIKEGVDVMEAGKGGVTNGGIMRTPSLVLCAGNADEAELLEAIRKGCIPTHHTSQAIEAAVGYGFALRAAMDGKSMEEITAAAKRGAEAGLRSVEYVAAAPTCTRRLEHIQAMRYADSQRLREDLYYVYGTGLDSVDVFAAVMAIFLIKKEDVFGAICLAASLGGDTDTIGALVGALCAAYAGGHNIPESVLKPVLEQNKLDLETLSAQVASTFWK